MSDIREIISSQRQFYGTGITRDLKYRRQQLENLLSAIQSQEQEVAEALHQDLHKSEFEAYETEIGIVYGELRSMLRHLTRWAKPRAAAPSILHFPASGRIYREPYGSVLIMSPWNYPFQLAMIPLIGAIGAGNCAVVKPSAYSPATSAVVEKIIRACFEPAYVATVTGGRAANQDLLEQKWDYIFFTGSPTVGRLVMEAASHHLTPVTLELGGKSPCIVDETADVPLAARRIAWGKLLNAGQTCIAPDYLLVQEGVKDQLVEELRRNAEAFYGPNPVECPAYPRIVNRKHYDRLCGLLEDGRILAGGVRKEETLQIGPTLIDSVDWDSPIMEQEIFGPIFPILTFHSLEEVLPVVRDRPKPLALYLFTRDRSHEKQVLDQISFGGGCINDTIVHIANEKLYFGGVGESGMGRYHGKASFDTFTHEKPVIRRGNWLDIGLRYPPYGKHLKLLKWLMK